jgi:hypothetical protein
MGFRYLVRDQEVEGSNPFAPTTFLLSNPDTKITERTGYIGNTLGQRAVQRVQSFFLQIDVRQIVIRRADEPNTLFDSLYGNSLPREDGAEIIFL